jgi:hypothetical protein
MELLLKEKLEEWGYGKYIPAFEGKNTVERPML